MSIVVSFMDTNTIIFGGLSRLIMRKLICDRCGREIDQGFADKYDMKPKAFCRIYGKNDPQLVSDPGDLEYDLCENCANELVTFLKG